MRADAVRRRADLLREARRLFAERGGGVPLDDVAEAAGVGIATLYRNFESRAELVEHVALDLLSDIAAATARASAALAGDPAGAWDAYVDALVALDLGALTAALSADLGEPLVGHVRAAQDAALAGVEALLREVRAARLVPEDLGALELVIALGVATRPVSDAVRDAAPHLRERVVGALVAGLHAQADAAAAHPAR